MKEVEYYLADVSGYLGAFDVAIFKDDEHALFISHFGNGLVEEFMTVYEKDTLAVFFSEDGFPKFMTNGHEKVIFGNFSQNSSHLAIVHEDREYDVYDIGTKLNWLEYRELMASAVATKGRTEKTINKETTLAYSTLYDELLSEALKRCSGMAGSSLASAALYSVSALGYLVSDDPVWWQTIDTVNEVGGKLLLLKQLIASPTALLAIGNLIVWSYDIKLIWDGIKDGKFGSPFVQDFELLRKEIDEGIWLGNTSGNYSWREYTGTIPVRMGIANFDISDLELGKKACPEWADVEVNNLGYNSYISYKIHSNEYDSERTGILSFYVANVANVDYDLAFTAHQGSQLKVDKSVLCFDDDYKEQFVIVTSDDFWEISYHPSWITVEKQGLATDKVRKLIIKPTSFDNASADRIVLKATCYDNTTYEKYISVLPYSDELRQKLIKFYYDTDGPHWTNHENWCSEKPLEEWYGVSFNNNGGLELSLPYNDLKGDGDLSDLRELEYLDLSDNNMSPQSMKSLSVSGCTSLYYLNCCRCYLQTLDISGCTNLQILACCQNYRLSSSLDLSGCKKLKTLECYENQIPSLNVSSSELESITAHNNCLTSFKVSGCPIIEHIDVSCNNLTSLDVSGCSSLKELWCEYNQLSQLGISGCSSLKDLWCSGNNLPSLNVSGYSQLELLSCIDNPLKSLDASNCPKLTGLTVSGIKTLKSIDVSRCYGLKSLGCGGNNLTSLNVTGCSNLETLTCVMNNLTRLDVSSCTKLKSLACENNPITQEITFEDSIPHFRYDYRFEYWVETQYDEDGNEYQVLLWGYSKEDQTGWYYAGEPGKGYHGI